MGKDSIDVGALLRAGLKYWYFFVLGLGIAAAVNIYLLRRTHPVYEAAAQVLIADDENAGEMSQAAFFSELGINSNSRNIENEIAVLTSTPLVHEVVKQMNLQYQYFRVERFLERELYGNSPITITQWTPTAGEYFFGYVEVDQLNSYTLTTEHNEEELVLKGEFGKPLKVPNGFLTLTFSQDHPTDDPIAVRISSTWGRAKGIKSAIGAWLTGPETSVVQLSIQDQSRDRAREIITKLIEIYNSYTVDKRNQVFRNTIDLINSRIALINEELTEVEMDVEDYKQQNNVVEMSAEGSMILEELTALNRQSVENDIQLTILQSIEDFLVQNKDDFEFVPTNASLNNLTLSTQLSRFNQLLTEHDQMAANLGPKHPDLLLVEEQLKNFRETIIENIRTIRSDLEVEKNSTLNQKSNLQQRMTSLPRQERQLVEIERRKGVKENLYVYLLQKREESAISMAVTTARGEVVEPAQANPTPIKPNSAKAWLAAMFLGLGLPAGIVLLRVQLNDKIETEKDLRRLTDLDVAGVLSKSPKKTGTLIVGENSRSAGAEMFRMLRANLSYILPGDGSKAILVASSISGEGKSFISTNLSMVLALSGKRVIIIQADLRKPSSGLGPKKSKKNGRANHPGLVNYIVNESLTVDDVVQRSGLHDYLDVIATGPKPPNPGELIMSERLRQLMAVLRSRYDYIILDTPPLGVVADVFQMSDMADATLLVTRAKYTRRGHIEMLNKITADNKVPKPSLVLNAVTLRDFNYGKYGYTYNYYGAGKYFSEEA